MLIFSLFVFFALNFQNLRGRLNYLQSLSNWDESDMEPLVEEFRLLMAKQFSVR